MNISLTIEATAEAAEKLNIVYIISDYLYKEMYYKKYGDVIEKVICTLNCYDPNFGLQAKDWETGIVISKKYIKRSHYLEFSVKINHNDLIKTSVDNVPHVIRKAILQTYIEIKNLNIKGFEIDKFYSDIDRLLTLSKWKTNPEDYMPENFDYKKHTIPKSDVSFKALKESDFWGIIKDSIKISKGNIEAQIESLIDILVNFNNENIIGFEITLRSLLKKAYHVNVMALEKVVEGYLTDDSFLYFRAKLILLGKLHFYQAIEDPNHLNIIINQGCFGEELLSVADKAFKKKFGLDYHEELPRDIVGNILDYDDLSEDPKGTMWQESEFKDKYAGLLALYARN
jgi:hypothetical protein